ncbi:MAG TPA: MG2 domain-containing protein, partial [Desulfobaccales bacterium]
MAAFWAADLGPLAAPTSSQERRPAKAGAALSAPDKQFTIIKIEPDAKKEEVNLSFSKPVPLEGLKNNLRLLPLVKINWRQSTMSPEGRLTLKGRFKYGVGYVVSLPENFTLTGQTYVPTVISFFMPDRPPKVEFVEAKNVIELDSRELLHVRAQNVKSLLLEGLRVPPLLLPLALSVEDSPADWGRTLSEFKAGADQLKKFSHSHQVLAPFFLEPFAEKQLFGAPGQKNKPLAVSLPLSFRRDKEAGALELIRVGEDQAYSEAATAPRVFRITDLGLTYKLGGNQLLLWATSLKNAVPLTGVRVVGFTRDLAVFPLGQTDKDGILIFQPQELAGLSLKNIKQVVPVKRRVDLEQLVCLLAGNAGDVSFIQLKPADRLKPQGIWQVRAGERLRRLKGQVFTERGIYRPGETVHFKGLVREYQEGRITSPQGEVCSFEVTNPKGEKVYSGQETLSDFGSAAADLTAAKHWPLGTYTLTMDFGPQEQTSSAAEESEAEAVAKPPKNEATCTFQVQEFKAPRHFVEIDFHRLTRAETSYVNLKRTQEFVKIGLTGAYYAGGPVKHGQVRWKVHKAKTSYQV